MPVCLGGMSLKVKIVDFGFSREIGKYYITYLVEGLNLDDISKLQTRLEDPIVILCDKIYLSTYFEEKYFPFHTPDSERRKEDYVAREEIEMTAYIIDLLSD
jgi:hypothetical protein